MPTPTVINKWRYSDAINRRYWDNKYFFDGMQSNPANVLLGGGAAAGAASETDVMISPTNNFEYFNIVGNANIGPKLDGTFGLNLAADAVSTHGVEYNKGTSVLNPFGFTIDTTGATQPAFFVKAQFKVATVAGASQCIVGFRKVEANNATFTSYTDLACIGIVGTAGKFQTVTNLASAGDVTTDTTQVATNATMFQVTVLVDALGNVTYQINGQPPTVVAAYQFANGLNVMPFIRVTQSVTTTATASCNYWECGYQS